MKPQDIVVMLKILIYPKKTWSINDIAHSIKLSNSETHAAIKRCQLSGLFDSLNRRPNKLALEEFIIHGIKYAFPAIIGTISRGKRTAYSAPPMNNYINYNPSDIYVWPYENGEDKGLSIIPLYRTVPIAAEKDQQLYELLVLIDCLRIGKAREINIAIDELKKRLQMRRNRYDQFNN